MTVFGLASAYMVWRGTCSRHRHGRVRSAVQVARRPSLLERPARTFHVIGGNHDLHAAGGGVGEIDVDVSVGELPGEFAQCGGAILELNHPVFARIGDPQSGAFERRPAPGDGLVVQQHMDDTPALTGERRKAMDTDVGFTSNLGQPGKLTGPVLENHCQVGRHRILDLLTAVSAGQSGLHRDPTRRTAGDGLECADGSTPAAAGALTGDLLLVLRPVFGASAGWAGPGWMSCRLEVRWRGRGRRRRQASRGTRHRDLISLCLPARCWRPGAHHGAEKCPLNVAAVNRLIAHQTGWARSADVEDSWPGPMALS